MTEEKKAEEKKKPILTAAKPTDWNAPVAVAHLWFDDAGLDFNSHQSNVPCGAELGPTGSTYVCWYLPAWDSFQLLCGRNGTFVEERMMPTSRIRRWVRAK